MDTEITDDKDFYNFYSKKFLNVPYLYPYQRLLIDYTLSYNGFHNSKNEELPAKFLAILPTGYGKSLCFTLPALLLKRPSLFIFPLRSLIFDQKRRLKENNIDCSLLIGGQSKEERRSSWQKIFDGSNKIILSNPETLLLESEQAYLNKLTFSQIVIDEVHTLISWGKSFRKAYLELAKWLRKRDKELICAYSATVSTAILKQLEKELITQDYYLIRADSDRINLRYSMIPCLSKEQSLLELLEKTNKPALIFVATRYLCETLSYSIRQKGRLECAYYHAGLSNSEKETTEKWFFNSENGLLIATCAYGMGIDKANIRSVIHYNLPTSIEAYLQEAGRAGRDGKLATAILLYGYEDFINAQKNSAQRPLFNITLDFQSCRRQALLKLLATDNTFCHGCDVCEKKATPFPQSWLSFRKLLRKFTSYAMDVELLSDFLHGFASPKLCSLCWQYDESFGILSSWRYTQVKEAVESFLCCDWLAGEVLSVKQKNKYVSYIRSYKKLQAQLMQKYFLLHLP